MLVEVEPFGDCLRRIVRSLNDLPAANVADAVHGRWIGKDVIDPAARGADASSGESLDQRLPAARRWQ